MSASISPTLCPSAARATAKLAVRVDLPTPPLPEPTKKMFVRVSLSKGLCFMGFPPRSLIFSASRSAGVITESLMLADLMPFTFSTAALDSLSILREAGHPVMVSFISTSATPSGETEISPTMSSSVRGMRSSGSITFERASIIASCTLQL